MNINDDYENRILNADYSAEDAESETSLRPARLDDYVGQSKVKENLKISIDAAKLRGETLDHVLLYGPPGLGKTTLSSIIAHEMGVNIRVTSGPAIEKQNDLIALLTNLNERDVLFIDEIHRLPRQVEEILYPAMVDYAVDITIGKGPLAQRVNLPLPKFTLVGETTRTELLSTQLLDCFGILLHFKPYNVEDMAAIILKMASVLGVEIDKCGALELASRSRGNVRFATRLLKRVRDYAQVRGNGKIDRMTAIAALDLLEIDIPELGGNTSDEVNSGETI